MAKLIFTCFIALLFCCCNEFEKDKLLTFYYHAEDSLKKTEVSGLAKEFEKSTGIKIITKSYFDNDLTGIMRDKSQDLDFIELSCNYILEAVDMGFISSLDSILNVAKLPKYIKANILIIDSNKYAIPWLYDPNTLIINDDLLTKSKIRAQDINTIEKLIAYSESVSNSNENIKGFAMEINNNGISFNSFFEFLIACGGEIKYECDSIRLNDKKNVEALKDFIYLSRYSFWGTKSEIEKEFIAGKIGIIKGNRALRNSIKKGNPLMNISSFEYLNSINPNVSYKLFSKFLCLSKKSSLKRQTIRFLNFFYSDSTIKMINKNYDEFAAIHFRNIINKFELSADKSSDFNNQLGIQLCLPRSIEEIIEKTLYNALTATESPESSLESAQERINKLLRYKSHKKNINK